MNKPIDLPAPPISADVDLRDFQFMPLDVVRLRDSDLALTATAEGFRAAVMLWCAAWHQRPPGSLPNNDKAIARLAGCDADALHRIRDEALHGFELFNDGRLYHLVVVEKAIEAWNGKERYRKAANKRWKNKKKLNNASHVKCIEDASSDACKTYMQGTGTGTGTKKEKKNTKKYTPEFENLWSQWKEHRVAKGSKKEAFNEWNRHVVDEGVDQEMVARRAVAYCKECRNTDTGTRHVSRWVKFLGWEDPRLSESTPADRPEWLIHG